jgi:hypothetical protein
MNTRVFTSRYRAGVFFAPGRGLLILPFVFVPGMTLFKSALVAAVFALGAFLGATWFWTQKRKASPAVILSAAGAMIDGAPALRWTQIASVRRGDSIRPELEISLTAPIAAPRPSPLIQMIAPRLLVLRAYLLADPPEDVEDAFTYFLGKY